MSFQELSSFYRNLAELENSGISLAQSFETFLKGERRPERVQQYRYITQQLKAGRPLTQSLKFLKFVPMIDIPMIQAGESSGRLVEVLKVLSKRYSETVTAAKSIRGQLIQPFLTFLVALFVPPLPAVFSGSLSLATYLLRSFGGLAITLGLAFGFHWIWRQSYFNFQMGQLFHGVLRLLPFFRPLSLKMAEEKFASTLAMMLESGIDVFSAIQMSSHAAGPSNIREAAERMMPLLQKGMTLSAAFQMETAFSLEMNNAIHMGSESGTLPEFLKRHSSRLKDQIDERMRAFVKIFPILIYIFVAAYVAFSIVSSSMESMNSMKIESV